MRPNKDTHWLVVKDFTKASAMLEYIHNWRVVYFGEPLGAAQYKVCIVLDTTEGKSRFVTQAQEDFVNVILRCRKKNAEAQLIRL